jgi:integrase
MTSTRDVGELIDRYRPRLMPPEAGVFARTVVAAAAPPSATRAKALLWAAARLAAFGLSVGLEADAAVLLHRSVVERFVLVGCTDVSPAARRTLRANVRWLSKTADRHGPPPVALPREHAKTPYTPGEIARWLALADAQGSEARRMRAQGLVCLGAGAGLTGSELAGVAGGDVVCGSGTVVVTVGGRRPRSVPVLAAYAARLAASAAFAGTGWVIGGVDPARHNLTTPLIDSLCTGADLGRLDTRRLRATWLADVAGRIGLKAFMDAAGICCSQRLGDLVAALPALGEIETMTLLGAAPP